MGLSVSRKRRVPASIRTEVESEKPRRPHQHLVLPGCDRRELEVHRAGAVDIGGALGDGLALVEDRTLAVPLPGSSPSVSVNEKEAVSPDLSTLGTRAT